MTFLTESIEINKIELQQQFNLNDREALGQFFTPAPLARFMAEQFDHLEGDIRLLDPGAGIGILTAAFVEKLLNNSAKVKSCFLTAYEVDPTFYPLLKNSLNECCLSLQKQGIKADYYLSQENFITVNQSLNLPLFSEKLKFTHAILNPPYKKINKGSDEQKILTQIGIDTVNLYSAFVWLAMLSLEEGGELTAITPRSFCNGAYFRKFRQAFLGKMSIDKIHIFESRNNLFSGDKVLQENIIFKGRKLSDYSSRIIVTYHEGEVFDKSARIRWVDSRDIVNPNDPEMFINIVTDDGEDIFRKQMEALPSSLEELGLSVSTGPVVDFRLKTSLRDSQNLKNVPLIYPESIKNNQVLWPPKTPRKPIAIEDNEKTRKWLNQPGWYVLTKRFSAKEEKRRVVAAVCPPLESPFFGIENHLNYYHIQGQGLNVYLARGLAAFLNSTLLDHYFRQFSGHTQINATDLRKIRYPCQEDLMRLGHKIGDAILEQNQLDELINNTLPIMSETQKAIKANQRLEEALIILKKISAPKEQQNERSALCLLALAAIEPETSWSNATAPQRRITEMMEWFRLHYGKQYAPNTRETVRRQTMHQFVQMGLVIENSDQPDRPINSPKWCYQLHDKALNLLRAYDSEEWENAYQDYRTTVVNLLQDKKRNLRLIPVSLPDGQNIELSAGGQNELIKAVLENFCPRFTPAGMVLYIGDAGTKFIINETDKFQEMGIVLDPHGKMPDVVIYDQPKDWIILIEVVTSHGPINLKRRNELIKLFQPSGKGLVFVTAFPNRKNMSRYLAEISWETEVWIADQPDHLIHFNGERFLGPYEDFQTTR